MYSQIALRQLSLVARVSARSYTSSSREGSVAASREFGKKEKAHEDQYIKTEERRKLEKLKAKVHGEKESRTRGAAEGT
ncbi:hypothetical protein BGY98DRAFT_594024 [Russula aff. rugulosa BPL654]|nr:hypothetical protein BGY98DRAFT_594024 [Russula aff. rugulosa BPL654]